MFKTAEQTNNFSSNKSCCTWQEKSDCSHCSLQGELDCKWSSKLVLRFLLMMLPSFIMIFGAIIYGAIFIGDWWWLGVIIGYFALFFIIETRILCSHCPYYSEEGVVLHCLANHGFIKFYRYHPEPITKFGEVLLIIGFLLFALAPLSGQIYNIILISFSSALYNETVILVLLILLGISIITIIGSFTFLFTRICPMCVNFSCPFNKVTKEKVDEYLNNNPTMKQAWIDCGYIIEEEKV